MKWHPADSASFLRAGEFVNRVAQESRRLRVIPPPIKALWKEAAMRVGLSLEALCQGRRSARAVKARDRCIQRAVLEVGYRASEVTTFLRYQESNVNWVPEKGAESRERN